MKKLLVAVLFAVPMAAQAAKVVSDPVDSRVTHCGVLLDGGAKVVVPVTVSGASKICSYDVSNVSNGNHTIKMTAIIQDTIWGNQESAESLPLAFVRPAPPAVPGSLGLQP